MLRDPENLANFCPKLIIIIHSSDTYLFYLQFQMITVMFLLWILFLVPQNRHFLFASEVQLSFTTYGRAVPNFLPKQCFSDRICDLHTIVCIFSGRKAAERRFMSAWCPNALTVNQQIFRNFVLG